MGIHFTSDDWQRIRSSHAAWWKGELNRPLVHCTVHNAFEPGRSAPPAPLLSQANCHDFSLSPEALIDALDYDLSTKEFLGDAYPQINLNCFGPGVTAAFAGAKLDNSSGRVWFFPEKELPISEITIQYNPESKWVRRIKDIYSAGFEKWHGNVLMGMPDLGGTLDIVASFVGSENLLYALIDEPDEVKRLTREAHNAFWAAYRDLDSFLQAGGNPGYSDWDKLYSETPSYILQSDFTYMIGPDMFKEFARDELAESACLLSNVIYHMDGTGQINHLPHLLSIPSFKAIQWVPGDGNPTGRVWMDIYRQIVQSGRSFELVGSREDFLSLLPEFPGSMYFKTEFDCREQALAFLRQAGIY